jgi:hypothetical protein
MEKGKTLIDVKINYKLNTKLIGEMLFSNSRK